MTYLEQIGKELKTLSNKVNDYHEYDMRTMAPIIIQINQTTQIWLDEYQKINQNLK